VEVKPNFIVLRIHNFIMKIQTMFVSLLFIMKSLWYKRDVQLCGDVFKWV